jgi:thiol-disulfide isomerase/thioredoxin
VRRLLLLSLAALLVAAAPSLAAESAPGEAELDAARRALARQRYAEAARGFRKADKLAGGRCGDCQLGLAKALKGAGDIPGALAAATAAVANAPDEFVRAHAENERGLALLALGEKDPDHLEPAAAAFRRVLEITAGNANVARVNLAEALLRLERDAEATTALQEYLAREPEGPSAARARELIATPDRARKPFIPDFELATLAGEAVRDETYAGRVLLLDFWATWCGPCVAAVPSLREMARKLAGEPFTLLSVSTDRQRKLVERFVAKHEMDWPQVWDGDGGFSRRLGINSFPTYVLVDHTGAIVYRTSGWAPQIERELRRRIAAAVAAAKAAAPVAAR